MAEPQLKNRLNIPRDLSSGERQLVARRVIEFIQDRTDKGRGVGGGKFPSYSDEYADSLEFKIAGKRQSLPNLQQSGDTIHSIKLLSNGPGYVIIGFDSGTEENDKAVWLQRSDNGVSRVFLGISNKELAKIVKSVQSLRTDSDARTQESLSQSVVAGVLRRLGI